MRVHACACGDEWQATVVVAIRVGTHKLADLKSVWPWCDVIATVRLNHSHCTRRWVIEHMATKIARGNLQELHGEHMADCMHYSMALLHD